MLIVIILWTRTADTWPVPVELGAAWAPATSSDVAARLSAAGLGRREVAAALQFARPDGSPVDGSDRGERAIADALAWAASQAVDTSLASALQESTAGALDDSGDPPTAADWLDDALRRDIGISRGADPATLSSWYGTAIDAAPDSDRVTGGYDRLVTESLDGIDVWLSSAVTALSYGDSGVSVRLVTGEAVSVDRVVVTVPLGVLKNQGIAFDPALPFTHRSAIAELGFGTTDAVWVRFDEPFWTTEAERWALVGSDLPIVDWINLEPATGEPVLVGLVGGDRAIALAELDSATLSVAVSSSLEPFAAAAAAAASTAG